MKALRKLWTSELASPSRRQFDALTPARLVHDPITFGWTDVGFTTITCGITFGTKVIGCFPRHRHPLSINAEMKDIITGKSINGSTDAGIVKMIGIRILDFRF